MKLSMNLRLFDGSAAGGTPSGAPEQPGAGTGTAGGESAKEVVYGIDNADSSVQEVQTNEPEVKPSENERVANYKKVKEESKDLWQKDVDDIINKKFKETRGLEEKIAKLDPILNILGEKYGIETNNVEAIVDAYINDPEQYKTYAEQEGLTLEQARKMKELERFKETQEAAQNRANADATYNKWLEEAETLKEVYPDFDISVESENPQFLKALRNGCTVQQAYEITYPEKLTERISREVTQAQTANVTSRQRRVSENGVISNTPVERRSNVKNFTPEDRKKAIEQSRKNGNGSVRFA